MRSGLYRGIAAIAVASASAVALVATAGGALADTNPPWEPDPQSVGTLTFYDASGNVVTSGPTDGGANGTTTPFAAYAVGSTTVHAGDVEAALFYAQPLPDTTTFNYFTDPIVGNFTPYPITDAGAPANIKSLSQTEPVYSTHSDDETLDTFQGDAVQPTDPAYQNMVQIRLVTEHNSIVTQTYDVADILIDPTAHTWSQVYPTPATESGVPGPATATAGDASARVSWSAPANPGSGVAGYNVQYSSNSGGTWKDASAAFHTSTATAQTVTGLTNGTSYVFRVAAVNAAGTGPYTESSNAVTPVADASALSIGGPTSVKYDATATITGKLTDSKTHGVLAHVSVSLYRRPSSTKPFTLVKTLTTSSTGSVSLGVKLTARAGFEWRYAGSATHKSVTSAIKSVSVTQVVSASHTKSPVAHGGTISVYGTVAPSGSGQKIYLQQLVGGKWKTITSTTIHRQKLPNNKTVTGFVLKVKLAKKGTFTYQVYKPATSTLASGVTGKIVLKAT